MKLFITAAFTLLVTLCFGQATETQTIDFPDIEAVKFGEVDMLPLFPKASSGLPVTLSYTAVQGSIEIQGNVLIITGAFAGTIKATQAGDATYLPVSVTRNFAVSVADRPITMDPIPEKTTSDPQFIPVVSPPNDITFSSTNTSVATIVGGQIKIVGKGTTTITATRVAGSKYSQASTIQELRVKDGHTIAFNSIPEKTLGDAPFELTATASSGLGITFSSSDLSVATIAGSTVTITGAGSTVITATSGNATFAVTSSTQVLRVRNATQTSAQQGQIFGIQPVGGAAQAGTIFRMNNDGSGFAITKTFSGGDVDKGSSPNGSLVLASNGKYYGTTRAGGAFSGGTMFEFDPATNAITKVYDFAMNDYPIATMIAGTNGKIYGAKSGQINNNVLPSIFEFDVNTKTFTKSKNIDNVFSGIVEIFKSSSDKIYATANAGDFKTRLFFEYNPSTNTLVQKASVLSNEYSICGFAEAVNGKFYGISRQSVGADQGHIVEFDPIAGTASVKTSVDPGNYSFTEAQGLMRASNGKFYGVAKWNGPDRGYIFEYDPATDKIKKLSSFLSYLYSPSGILLEGSNGKLYGSVNPGGIPGSIFEFNTVTNEVVFVAILNQSTGSMIPERMVISGNKLYASTSSGGAANAGTIIEFDYVTRSLKTLASFKNGTGGYYPKIGLTAANNGKLYGITQNGGTNDHGTLFEYDPLTDEVTTKVNFSKNGLGNFPQQGLTLGVNGKLYGSTNGGGMDSNSTGTFYEFDPENDNIRVITPLARSGSQGSYWMGEVVQASTGKIYAASRLDGPQDYGMLLEVDPVAKSVRQLHTFSGTDGRNPESALVVASNGKVYGTASGGSSDKGVLFEYDIATSTYSVKHNFNGSVGQEPGPLTEYNGKLYGLARYGGSSNGTVFEYNLATGQISKKYDFNVVGQNPVGKLLLASNGKLYGQTSMGGLNTSGVIFEFDPSTSAVRHIQDLPRQFIIGFNVTMAQTSRSMKRDQSITISPIEPIAAGSVSFAPNVVTSSGLPPVLSAGNSKISISGNKISPLDGGKAIVKANQPGNSSFNPAPETQSEFCVNPAKATIIFTGENTVKMSLTSSNTAGNQWYKDETLIPGSTAKSLEVTQPGLYSVKTTVEGCEGEMSLPFAVIVTGDKNDNELTQVYPNPVTDRLYITLQGAGRKRVTLLHSDGRTSEEHQTSGRLMEVDVRHYSPGLYIVRITDENGEKTPIKFIKK